MMRIPRRHREAGMSISMAVLALTIVAMIMLYVGTQTLNSLVTARTKQDRSVGMAAGDSAIEKYRAALHQRLADESNNFILDEAALNLLVREQAGTRVVSNQTTSVAAGMRDVSARIPLTARFTVVEDGTDSTGYWQVYDVLQPRYYDNPAGGRPASDLIVYIRAWATEKGGTTITTKPRIFRVEYRPGYFSDYQSVTDAPFFVRDNPTYTINGPVHSNGYTFVDWLARDAAGTSHTGIWFERAPACGAQAKFSTSQDAPIVVPGGSCAAARASARRSARQISLLGTEDTFAKMQSRCGAAIMQCRTGGGTYVVRLGASSVSISSSLGNEVINLVPGPDSDSLALLLDGDVRLSGALSVGPGRAGRVTIATRRRTTSDRRPQVYLQATSGGVVGAADPNHSSVGVITQGDVVLDTPPIGCLQRVNLAAISSAGSVTIPPELVTIAPPTIDLAAKACGRLVLDGSFSAHGQLITSIRWPDVRTGGWTATAGYPEPTLQYNRNLFLTPPPFFPTATPWSVTKVKDANDSCLIGPSSGDPRCE
jgi:hypothetical protein